MNPTLLPPYVLAPGEGRRIGFFGSIATIKADGDQTGGSYTLIEQHCPPGFANPLHVHHDEDEFFYVLDGELTVFCGNERNRAGPGTFIYGPREVPHGFRVSGDRPCRLLLLANPPGFERFVQEIGEPARGDGFPPPGPPPMDRLLPLAKKYRIDILGPLPD